MNHYHGNDTSASIRMELTIVLGCEIHFSKTQLKHLYIQKYSLGFQLLIINGTITVQDARVTEIIHITENPKL